MKSSPLIFAAVVSLLTCAPLRAGVFVVADGDVAALKAAITTANNNAQDDTIQLAANGHYLLSAVDNVIGQDDANGLPVIQSDGGHKLTIDGGGASIERSAGSNTPSFRILYLGMGADVTISGVTMANGRTISSGPRYGGAIYNNQARLTLYDCTFYRNFANVDGGAIFSPPFSVTRCTFSENSARFGGAILAYAADAGGAPLSIVNSTFKHNSALIKGGAIFTSSAAVAIANSTFSRNICSGDPTSNAIYSEQSISIGNSIFDNGAARSVRVSGAVLTSLGYNILSGDGVINATGNRAFNAPGDQVNTDPRLDPASLQDNGGPTQTIGLRLDSPALDKGKDVSGTGEDQRGSARPVALGGTTPASGGDFSDIGAVEAPGLPRDAAFVSQEVPITMNPGETYAVKITMKNIGTTTWSYPDRYKLGTVNRQDNTTWGFKRVRLARLATVAPGATYTFAFTVTAPARPGSYHFQWQMLEENVRRFGDKTPDVVVKVSPPLDASFVSQSVPTTMTAGATYNVSVTMRNTGTLAWTYADRDKLGSMNPRDNFVWGLNRIRLHPSDSVAPGETHTFTFTVTAPATPGPYNFQWQMLEEAVMRFGDKTSNVIIQVQ